MEHLLSAITAVLFVICVLTCRQIWNSRGKGPAIIIFVLRTTVLGLIFLLAKITLLDYKVSTDHPDNQGGSRKLLVLQDKSFSMTFPAGSSTRNEVAEAVWTKTKALAATRNYVDATRLLFATNYVEEDRANLLRTHSTCMGNALAGTLTRYQADAIVVVSDGAATDGQPPKYLMDWANNRGIGIYAVGIGTASSDMCDISVVKAECTLYNPESLSVELKGLGTVPERILVRLSIDGQRVASRQIAAQGRVPFTFAIPQVEEGWHEFEVEALSPENEICRINNRRMGVFHKSAPEKILFLYSSPQMEYKHLTRFLNGCYPERLHVVSAFSDEAKKLSSDEYVLCILANVNRNVVAENIRMAIDDKHLPTLFLAGNHLKSWEKIGQGEFPLSQIGRQRNIYSELNHPGRIIQSGGTSVSSWRLANFDMLPLYDIHEATASSKATTLMSAVVGSERYPLLIVDSVDHPKTFVILTTSSWRWGLSPDSQVRSSYRALWRRITSMAVKIIRSDMPLQLKLQQINSGDNQPMAIINHETESVTNELEKVMLIVTHGEKTETVSAEPGEDSWRASYSPSDEPPAVLWFQASAEFQGKEIVSERKPLVLNPDGQEYYDTLPHPERLRALVREPEQDVADASHADSVLERAFNNLKREPKTQHIRHRQRSKELTIAMIILLLLALEWFLERRFKERVRS